jgi:hypothetical protein
MLIRFAKIRIIQLPFLLFPFTYFMFSTSSLQHCEYVLSRSRSIAFKTFQKRSKSSNLAFNHHPGDNIVMKLICQATTGLNEAKCRQIDQSITQYNNDIE